MKCSTLLWGYSGKMAGGQSIPVISKSVNSFSWIMKRLCSGKSGKGHRAFSFFTLCAIPFVFAVFQYFFDSFKCFFLCADLAEQDVILQFRQYPSEVRGRGQSEFTYKVVAGNHTEPAHTRDNLINIQRHKLIEKRYDGAG